MAKSIGVQFAIGATMSTTVASAFATVDAKVKSLKSNVKELNTVSARAAALMTADSRLQDAKKQYAANPTEKHAKALASAERAYKSAERSAKKYNITTADAAKVHARAETAIKSTTAALERQEKFQSNAAKRRELHGQLMGTVAMASTVAVPIKLAIDYESAMADVKKVTNFDAPGWTKFSDDLLTLSTRIPMSAAGLAQIAASAGQAGIAENEMLRFVEDAAVMAVAFDITAAEAGSAMTGLRTNFKLSQDRVIDLGDAINQLANNMDATAGEIINFSTRAGRVGTQFGMTGEQVSALGASMIAMKMPAEVASRAVNSLFMKLGTADTAGKDAEASFRALGFSGKEMSQAFKKDAQGSLLIFLEAVKRSDDPIKHLKAILGEGFADEVAGLVGGLDEYKKALGLLTDPTEYAGSMQAEYSARAATTANSIDLMKNAFSRLGIIIGNTALPGITAVANGVVTLLEPVASLAAAFPGVTTAVFAVGTALVGLKVAAFAGAYAGTLLSDGWTIAKGVFTSLHPAVLRNTVALKAQRAVSIALAAGTKAMTVAQWALNLAMSANPVGIVIVAVAALAAGLVWLYRNCEPVRKVMDAVWSVVKVIGKNVLKVLLLPMALTWNAIKAVWGPASTWFSAKWNAIKATATAVWNGIRTVTSAVWDYITGRVTAAVDTLSTVFGPVAGIFSAVWEGVKAPAVAVFDWIGEKFEWVAGKFEWLQEGWRTVSRWLGDDEEEEAAKPDAVAAHTTVATDTVAAGASAARLDGPVAMAAQTRPAAAQSYAGGGSAPAQVAAPAAARPNVVTPNTTLQASFTFPINMNGVSSKDVGDLLVKAIQNKESALVSQLMKLLERIMSDQRRLAYDS